MRRSLGYSGGSPAFTRHGPDALTPATFWPGSSGASGIPSIRWRARRLQADLYLSDLLGAISDGERLGAPVPRWTVGPVISRR